MKVVKYISLITAFLLLVNIFSCKERNNDPDCHAPRDFLDYWFFPEGSWWVYSIGDSLIDSMTNRNHLDVDKSGYPCTKNYSVFYTHHNDIPLKTYDQLHSFLAYNMGKSWLLKTISYNNYWHFDYFYMSDAKVGQIINKIVSKTDSLFIVIEDTNAIKVKAGFMNNTVHTKFYYYYNTIEIPSYMVTDVWFSKNVGVTKIRYYDSSEIELLKYYINN